MKKAVADLAPALPVKVISFSNKSAFYAVFHTTCTFPGMPPKGLRPRGINFVEINARGSAGLLQKRLSVF